jgi:hypothetical protein
VAHSITVRWVQCNNVSLKSESLVINPGTNFFGVDNTSDCEACVVTSSEGTVDALQDLLLVQQVIPLILSGSADSAATEGKIFKSCAPPVIPPS